MSGADERLKELEAERANIRELTIGAYRHSAADYPDFDLTDGEQYEVVVRAYKDRYYWQVCILSWYGPLDEIELFALERFPSMDAAIAWARQFLAEAKALADLRRLEG